MPRKSPTTDPEDGARHKLVRAQIALETAQQKRTAVKVAGEHDIEQARRRAAKRLEKATEDVERRAQDVARAERSLRSLQESPQAEELVAVATGKSADGE